jgi:hypothetical protein
MKRFLALAVVAVVGVWAAGSAAQADHFRSVSRYHGGDHGGGNNSVRSHTSYRGGYGGGCNSNYGYSSYRPSYGYGAPVYGYGYPSSGCGQPVYGSGFSVYSPGLQFGYYR